MREAAKLSSKMVALFGVLWLAVVTAGFTVLSIYKSTPGPESGLAPLRWPAQSKVQPSGKRATLVMFAHPRCACTRASIAELAQLMARVRDRLDSYVLFLMPSDAGADWSETDLWSSAGRIPGVTVLRDDEGREAARFGMTTSGGVVLYDEQGKLSFHGGITSARGHEGNSFGRERILSLLTGGTADRADAPVFGCELQGEQPMAVASAQR